MDFWRVTILFHLLILVYHSHATGLSSTAITEKEAGKREHVEITLAPNAIAAKDNNLVQNANTEYPEKNITTEASKNTSNIESIPKTPSQQKNGERNATRINITEAIQPTTKATTTILISKSKNGSSSVGSVTQPTLKHSSQPIKMENQSQTLTTEKATTQKEKANTSATIFSASTNSVYKPITQDVTTEKGRIVSLSTAAVEAIPASTSHNGFAKADKENTITDPSLKKSTTQFSTERASSTTTKLNLQSDLDNANAATTMTLKLPKDETGSSHNSKATTIFNGVASIDNSSQHTTQLSTKSSKENSTYASTITAANVEDESSATTPNNVDLEKITTSTTPTTSFSNEKQPENTTVKNGSVNMTESTTDNVTKATTAPTWTETIIPSDHETTQEIEDTTTRPLPSTVTTRNTTMEPKIWRCVVKNLTFDNTKENLLTWKKPDHPDCANVNYSYQVDIQVGGNNATSHKTSDESQQLNKSMLEVNVTAKATVFSIDNDNILSIGVSIEIMKHADVPDEPTPEAENNIDAENRTESFRITWPQDLIGSEHGEIQYWTILISESSDGNRLFGYKYEEQTVQTWAASDQGRKGWYKPKEKIPAHSTTFIVGDENCNKENKDVYCNGRLLPDRRYFYKIRGYTLIGYSETTALQAGTVPSTNTAGVLIGSFMVLALIGAIIFSLLYTRRHHPRCIQKVRQEISTFRGSHQARRDQPTELQESKPFITKSIVMKEFADHFAKLNEVNSETNSTEMAEQFKQLAVFSPPPPSTHPENYLSASKQFNRRKNRYINILPYESTRVVLSVVSPNDPESDYINASFVKGKSERVEYIACQGPLSETAEDFWRMVFEKDVSVIVMVTNLQEKGKVKCHKYFPDLRETMRYERIAVKCILHADFPVHTRRTFLIQETEGVVLKTVIHLHFREWPDFGCPESTDLLINFCNSVRESAVKCPEGLVLVHCSAGVGRTGTLIALDMLMQDVKEKKELNVFETILNLRFQRINMVQTEGQYKYIHECLRDVIEEHYKQGYGSDTDDELSCGVKDPIYENLNKKKQVDRPSSELTEIIDVEELVNEENKIIRPLSVNAGVRISHYKDNTLEDEALEIVIPLKEDPQIDTISNSDEPSIENDGIPVENEDTKV